MIIVRPFSPTDIQDVMDVVKRSLGEVYPPSLYLTMHNLWREGFIIALEDGQVVGFLAAVESGAKVARVLMLAVLPESRKRSHGSRLLSELYAACIARGLDTVVLEVRKSNKEALAFYERHGYSVFGEIENFYSNGEGAFKMMKVLSS
ncbi:MAG: hypothetical protein A3K67_02595 [Euryarchaeota archaeon RBG_16_62_10]|nr:MAG: hypothetical protein A3K67_02595 [Euryarchaeota archaeon RBG_16_62_10]